MTLDRAAGRRCSHADLQIHPLCGHVYSAFWRLEQSRQRPMEDPQAFTYAEIAAWCGLAGETLASWELDAIMAMDIARRGALYEVRAAGDKPPRLRRTVSFGDTDAAERLFDSFGEVEEV